jgi:phosphoesterase RecJ-like protein
MKIDRGLADQAWQRIKQGEQILVCSHTRPDGDAVGSVLALGMALKMTGKQVEMGLADGVPAALRFFPGYDQIVNQPEHRPDTVIVVDSGNRNRVGNLLDDLMTVDINIDHHPDNAGFASLNLVNNSAVSTTEILANLFELWGLELNIEIASNLLGGLITDTIGFKTENMQPDALRLAADLFESGADLPGLYHHAVSARTFEAARYIGAGLVQTNRQNGLVWTVLSLKDRKEANYNGRDDADLVNILSAIDSAEVALIFVEQHEREVKVSWRTRNPQVDVSRVAHHYGGGGHRAAAGAMIRGTLTDVQSDVVETTLELLGMN